MTIFAGIYCKNAATAVPAGAVADIRGSISRNDGHEIKEFNLGRYYVACVDTGALGSRGISVDNSAGITVISGDPILRNGGERQFMDRSGDTDRINERFANDDPIVLSDASGTFAGVYCNVAANRFSLFTDKIGVRQVFVWDSADFVVFATALRIMEEISLVPKRLSLKGLIEEIELHWSTGRRTPYADIKMLAPAEIINATDADVRSGTYWQWPANEKPDMTMEDHLSNCHARFLEAINVRMAGDQEVLAFLSGGLDSRTIVAGLSELGRKVDTINFAPPNTQDRVYAEIFSKAIGSTHLQMPFTSRVVDKSKMDLAVAKTLRENIADGRISPDRPQCIWGGYGGSVGLGHVYMTTSIVDKVRQGDFQGAIDLFRQNRNAELARKPLRRSVFEKYRSWPNHALIEELSATTATEPQRQFYFFLLNNDQRRSLHFHYEVMDANGLEYLLPFFDSEFLTAVSRVPVEASLYHRFYNQWLDQFDDSVTSTPWQSYPGHQSSKVQLDDGLGYQFDQTFSRDWHRSRREVRLARANAMLAPGNFPETLLARSAISIARLTCLMGSDRLGYAIDKGYQYYRYASRSSEIVYD